MVVTWRPRTQRPLVGCAVLLLSVSLSLALPRADSIAQPGSQSGGVLSVDVSSFPDVALRFAPATAEGITPGSLGAGEVQLLEDGQPRAVAAVAMRPMGAQIAIVLDASESLNREGASGKLRRVEALDAIRELVLSDTWLPGPPGTDLFTLIVPRGAAGLEIPLAQPWVSDGQAIHSAAYVYDYPRAPVNTPPYPMLVEAMARFKDADSTDAPSTRRARFVLILSDGVDQSAAGDIEDLIYRARAIGVTFMCVRLGANGVGDATTMRRLAEMTGGTFTVYATSDSLKPLYSLIRSRRAQYVLRYRSRAAQAGRHQVQVILGTEGTARTSATAEFEIDVRPAAVRLFVSGIDGSSTRLTVSQGQPIEIAVEVEWPDGHPRRILETAYWVDGERTAILTGSGTWRWDVSGILPGAHILQAEVRDELGLIAQSDALRAIVRDVPVPANTAAPSGSGAVEVSPPQSPANEKALAAIGARIDEAIGQTRRLAWVALVVASLALALAAIGLWRAGTDPAGRRGPPGKG